MMLPRRVKGYRLIQAIPRDKVHCQLSLCQSEADRATQVGITHMYASGGR